MILEAEKHGCVGEVLVIAAALSIQDPRERPSDQQQKAAELHGRFADRDSDFITYLNLWRYLRTEQKARGSSQFRKMCKAEMLHFLRVREWQDLHSQLRQIARGIRSEEHTSELQSLMRISYAVFFLKKKKSNMK